MSLETAKKAIEIPKGKFKLQLAGGESLLNFQLIEEIYHYVKSRKPNTKIQLQTNGTLITYEMAKKIKEMDLAVGVSLDGPYEVNEILRGGTGNTIEGIRQLGQAGVMINLNCVITDQSIRQLDRLIDWAFVLGNVVGIGLDLLRETGRAEKNNIKKASPEEIGEYLRKANNQSIKLFEIYGRKIHIREIEDATTRLIRLQSCTNYCYASVGSSMVVLPDGRLYPCGSLVGKLDYFMGNIHDESSWRNIKLDRKGSKICEECTYKDVCIGACPARSILNNTGDSYTPEDCALRKTAFEIVQKEMKLC